MNTQNKSCKLIFILFLSLAISLKLSAQTYSPNHLKKKQYFSTIFTGEEQKKLADGEADFRTAVEEMKIANTAFRKAKGYEKINKKSKQTRYEKKSEKSMQKAYSQHIKSINKVFKIYAAAFKRLPQKNDKQYLDAESFSIDAREAFLDSEQAFKEADKASGSQKTECLKKAFDKKTEAVELQEKAFDLCITGKNEKTSPETEKTPKKTEKHTEYKPEKDRNLYVSQEDKVTEHLNISADDRVKLKAAGERRRYANILSKEADKEYTQIAEMRAAAKKAETDFDRDMKLKMATGMEQILFDKMIRTADLYYQADSSKYTIYKKYFDILQRTDPSTKGEKYASKAADFHAQAHQKYAAGSKNTSKNEQYITKMNAAQAEQAAIRAMENSLLSYPRQNSAPEYTPPIPEPYTPQKPTPEPTPKKKKNPAPSEKPVAEKTEKEYVQDSDIKDIKRTSGTKFFVQIGNFSSEKIKEELPQAEHLFVEKNEQSFKYFTGAFTSYEAADKEMNRLKKSGQDGFIVAYAEGKKISVQAAKSRKKSSPAQATTIKTPKVYFTVQLGIFSKQLNSNQRKAYDKIKDDYPLIEKNLGGGKYMYSAGKFEQYQNALNAKKDMERKGVKGFIVGLKGNKKISAAEARKLKGE